MMRRNQRGREFALAGRFVDGNDASDLKRGGGFLFGLVRAAFFVDVAENFELRLHDLQISVAILFDLAVERDHLSRLKLVLQICGVEPQALQSAAALANRELKNRHAACAKQSGVADFGNYRRHFSCAQFGDRARVQPVFIAKGQIVQQVVDGVMPLAASTSARRGPMPLTYCTGVEGSSI